MAGIVVHLPAGVIRLHIVARMKKRLDQFVHVQLEPRIVPPSCYGRMYQVRFKKR
jgi:hypothetical protein